MEGPAHINKISLATEIFFFYKKGENKERAQIK